MTVLEHVGAATNRLVAIGLEPPVAAIDAAVLARHVLGWSHATYLSNRREFPPAAFELNYRKALTRRERREPVSLIIGQREFWGLSFEITPDVLTPRPETELLIEEGLMLMGDQAITEPNLVDVGTGSGCLAISLAYNFSKARITATDTSSTALNVARRNAIHHNVQDRIKWVRTEFLNGISLKADLIVANLPYIPESDLENLQPEVRNFEPLEALKGGSDGLEKIRSLLNQASEKLIPGGYLIVEFGEGQKEAIRNLVLMQNKLELIKIRNDLSEIPRAAVIQRLMDNY
jgi:release factor glutamine methyltransferase